MESVLNSIKQPKRLKIIQAYPVSVALGIDFSVDDLLTARAQCFVKNIACGSGAVKVSGITLFNVLYKEEGELAHYESGADFSFNIENDKIDSFCLSDICAKISAPEIIKGENGIELTAQITVEGCLILPQETTYLSEIEGAITKTEQFYTLSFAGLRMATVEFEGEKTVGGLVDKVICLGDSAQIYNTRAGDGEVTVEGEIYSDLLIITTAGEKICERVITPFKYELDCVESLPSSVVTVNAKISERSFKVVANEEDANTLVSGEYKVHFYLCVCQQTAVNCVIDGFSATNELFLEGGEATFLKQFENRNYKYKCFGEGDARFDSQEKVLATLFPFVEIADYFVEKGELKISGLVNCVALTKGENGLQSKAVQTPFSAVFDCDGEPLHLQAFAKNTLCRNLDGKCLTESEIEFTLLTQNLTQTKVTVNFTEGAERTQKQSAISVTFINKGDDLWAVCKKALASEQVILADNPGITFPAKEDRAVVVYRKLN